MGEKTTEAQLARRQHGLVTRQQLLAAGLTSRQIGGRVRIGLLIPVHRGVYRVGHIAPSLEATYLAAVLSGGNGAVLSGRPAAHLHGLLRGSPPPPQITTAGKRRVRGVRCRESRRAPDATTVRGVPVTSVAWTLVDIAGELGEEALARAAHEAHARFRVGAAEVLAVLERRPNTRGARKIRLVMGGEVEVVLSRLEREFVRLLQSERLPPPGTNVPTGGRYVDCRWPELRLTVELDGYRFHASRHAWERDRRREREAYARGDQFRRYTYGDVIEHPAAMLRELCALLLSQPQ